MLEVRRFHINARVGVILAVIFALAIALLPSMVSAKTANTIKVSPVRNDIVINAGESKEVPITITNLTSDPITVQVSQNDFVAGDERGTPALILDENKYAKTHSLKRFMEPLPNITIPGNGAKTIKAKINVPSSAQAGGYFGAVRLSPASPDSGGQVNMAPSVATLILLTVPGDMVEKLDLTNFGIQQKGKPSNGFFLTPDDLQATVRFESDGNVQLGPFGKLSVLQGDDVVYEADFNEKAPRDMILPNSARQWEVPLKNVGSFGHYTVKATFTYGQTNQTVEVEKSFWVVPMWAIIAAGVFLIVLAVVIFLVVRRIRNRPHLSSRHYGYRRR